MDNNYVYRTTDEQTGEYYIGVRTAPDGDPMEDIEYMGSFSAWKPKNGGKNLHKEVLMMYPTREEANEAEAYLIGLRINEPLNRNYYIPNKGFCIQGNTLVADKISSALSGRQLRTEHKQNIARTMSGMKDRLRKNSVDKNPNHYNNLSDVDKQKAKIRSSKASKEYWGKVKRGEVKPPDRGIKVVRIEDGKVYDSATDAANDNGYANSSVVWHHCNGKRKNQKFKYLEQ